MMRSSTTWPRSSLWLALVALGCGAPPQTASTVSAPAAVKTPTPKLTESPAPAATAARAAEPERFGEPFEPAQPLSLPTLLAKPGDFAQQQVTVEGVVREVCRARGCWLELATHAGETADGCRVVMKGHAFFVPTTSAGRRVRVQGEADVKVVPVAQVAHMEQEGGRFPNKQPDGSAQELRIVARAVELLPEAKTTPL